jgi:hypothetical protein
MKRFLFTVGVDSSAFLSYSRSLVRRKLGLFIEFFSSTASS